VKNVSVNGFKGVNEIIDEAVKRRMTAGIKGQTTYAGAMAAIAQEQPALFLARERARLSQQVTPDETIYFDFVNGNLVNPAVIRNGKFVPLDSPLSDQEPAPGFDAAQEVTRLAQDKVASSDGKLDFGRAVKLVASERPDLIRRYRSDAPARERCI